MNLWRIDNAADPPQGNQFPHLEDVSNYDQVQVNHPPLTDGDIRVNFIQMAQVITTQA